jgi:hypothetical protein
LNPDRPHRIGFKAPRFLHLAGLDRHERPFPPFSREPREVFGGSNRLFEAGVLERRGLASRHAPVAPKLPDDVLNSHGLILTGGGSVQMPGELGRAITYASIEAQIPCAIAAPRGRSDTPERRKLTG